MRKFFIYLIKKNLRLIYEKNNKLFFFKDLIVSDIDTVLKKSKSLENYQHHIWKNFIESTDGECVKRYKNILLKNY